MPSRGTMGIRMSRIRVDGLLNNTSYWRVFPSDTTRKTVSTGWWPVTTASYVLYADLTIPAAYLPGSAVKVIRSLKSGDGATTVSSVIYKNGVQLTETIRGSTSGAGQVVGPELISVQGGDVLSCYNKTANISVPGAVDLFKIQGTDEGVIEAVGYGVW